MNVNESTMRGPDYIIHADYEGVIRWGDINVAFPEINGRISFTNEEVDEFERSLISVDELDRLFADGTHAFMVHRKNLFSGNLKSEKYNPHSKNSVHWREWEAGWNAERSITFRLMCA